MHTFRLFVRTAAAGLAAAGIAHGATEMPKSDLVPDVHDHPAVSRFAGAYLVSHGMKVWDEVVLPAGKAEWAKDAQGSNVPTFEKSVRVEGKDTRLVYAYAADRSALEVARNYEAALAKAGFKTLFQCVTKACGGAFQSDMLGGRVDPIFNARHNQNIDFREPFNWGGQGVRYMLASGQSKEGAPIYVAVWVVPPEHGYTGGVLVEVVEAKAMESDKVVAELSSDDMAKSIAADGKVAVYGVYFDTDRTEVKPESKTALAEMAKLLQQSPKLNVYVVGHTDNQGTLAHNLELSQKRADAVARILATEYKVDPARVAARGVASLAPVASNDGDGGRAKNRRVELVKQ